MRMKEGGLAGRQETPVVVASAVAVTVLILFMACSPQEDKSSGHAADDGGRRLERLRSVPYAFFNAEDTDTARSGVTRYDPDKVWPGYNLFGSGRSGQALLIDMEGRIIHKWYDPRERPGSMVLPVLMAGGDIMVIERFRGLLRLDRNSGVVWIRNMPADHDLVFLPDSTFYVLRTDVIQYRGLMVRFPSIVHFTLSGETVDEWSTFEHLDDIKRALDQTSFLDHILDSLQVEYGDTKTARSVILGASGDDAKGDQPFYDYFHANTLTILPENPIGKTDARFKAGNILTCFRNVNQVLVLDADSKQVTWAWGEGELEWPHDPTMVENGNILIFDNGVERGYSRVIEVNPVTGSIEWEYVGDPPETFYTSLRGSAQRLPNGNTLICESNNGRAFEVTRQGEIVWEWWNPEVTDKGRAAVYRMTRIDPRTVGSWLKTR
jgi:hypothetical protein